MTAESPGRLISLDALRGIAILLMVQDHAFDWWLRGEFQPTPWGRVTEFLGTLAAPLFLFLMGVSLALSAAKRMQRGMPVRQLAISQLRRGVFLVLQGYALTWLTFYNGQNAAEMSAVDVLHCLGLSMIVLIPLTLARTWQLTLAITAVAAILSPWLGGWDLPKWLAAWIDGSSGVSYFPLLPFLAYSLSGLTMGQLLTRASGHFHEVGRLMLASGLVGVGLFLLVPVVPPDLGFRFPRPTFLLFSLAVVLWLTALTHVLARCPKLLRPLTTAGQTAMMIYIVHHLLGFRVLYHLGWVTGHSWQGHYGACSPGQVCLLLLVLASVLYAMAELWLVWRPRIGSAAVIGRVAPALAAYW